MFIRQQIEEKLQKAISEVFPKGGAAVPVLVKPSDGAEHGDYASAVGFVLAKILHQNPQEVGYQIKKRLEEQQDAFFERVDVAGGFLNFTVRGDVYKEELKRIVKGKSAYGRGTKNTTSYSVEYLDANPTGPVHIGHARAGFLGDVLSNVLEYAGHKISREFYLNNAKKSGQIRSLGKTALGRGEEYRHDQLLRILKQAPVQAKLKKISDEGKAGYYIASLIHKENAAFLKKKAGIEYDVFFAEESVYKNKGIEKVLKLLRQKKCLYEKDGAVWFRASNFGDTEDRVLVRSTGDPTYFLPDIYYHLDRLEKRKFSRAINIFGADHHGYGPRLIGALQALGIDSTRIQIITTQTVRLIKGGQEFKMSKRKGIFETLGDLIDEVGLDAARFFFLMHAPDTHMDFDIDLAKEQSNKNPVYYVQYSHARIAGVIRNAGKTATASEKDSSDAISEKALLKKLAEYPGVVYDTARDFHVLRLTTYAIELARLFHRFYETNRILVSDAGLQKERLQIVKATQIVLKNALHLMGVSAPEKM